MQTCCFSSHACSLKTTCFQFSGPKIPANVPIEHILKLELYQHVKIFPEVLCHEAEESQEGPAEAVKAGVAVVWIPPSFHTRVALRAAAEVDFFRGKARETDSKERRAEEEEESRAQAQV